MTPKEDLLNRAAGEYKALHETLRGLNEEQMTEVWFGAWSIKDIVAHLSGWQRELAPALARMVRGEKPIPDGMNYDDVDTWNARFVAAAKDTAVADVLLEFDKSHEDFLHAADQVPDDRYQPGRLAYRIVDQTTAHHYREHADAILAWRAQRRV